MKLANRETDRLTNRPANKHLAGGPPGSGQPIRRRLDGGPFSGGEPTDEQLVGLLRKGDWDAFSTIYERHWKGLYLAAFNVVRDRAACEDVVQDIMVQLWSKRKELAIRSLQGYLYTAVRYQVFKLIRSGKVSAAYLGQAGQPFAGNEIEDLLREKELNGLLDEGIAKLPAKCRRIFIMSRREHLSVSEIAARLNITSKTVENHLTTALSRLRTGLKDHLICVCFFIWGLF